MKLNFWQIIGVVLLIVGCSWILYKQFKTPAPAPGPTTPTTHPATTRSAR